jgi:hypothetical protein
MHGRGTEYGLAGLLSERLATTAEVRDLFDWLRDIHCLYCICHVVFDVYLFAERIAKGASKLKGDSPLRDAYPLSQSVANRLNVSNLEH